MAKTGGRCRAYISSTHSEIPGPHWLLLGARQGLQHGSLNALDGPKRILLGYWVCVIDELEGSYSLPLDAFRISIRWPDIASAYDGIAISS